MFTYQFLPSFLSSPTPTGCSRPSPSCRRSLTPTCPSKCNTCWTTAGLRASNSRTRRTPTLTVTVTPVWTPPSTPTTTTTDTGSCGSCRCTVATTRLKSSLKWRLASRRSRTATSDAPASTTSSKCNATPSWCTDRSCPRWRVVLEMSPTDKSKFA